MYAIGNFPLERPKSRAPLTFQKQEPINRNFRKFFVNGKQLTIRPVARKGYGSLVKSN